MSGENVLNHLTDAGIPGVTKIPFGAHFCHFYRDRWELMSIVVPYLRAGLQNRERCIWVAADPFVPRLEDEELSRIWPEFEVMIKEGHLQIHDGLGWYSSMGKMDGQETIERWKKECEKALADGYQGLRITGNTSFLQRRDWEAFMEYEHDVTDEFLKHRITALCSYSLARCRPTDVFEVARNHGHALHRDNDSYSIFRG